MKMYHEKRQRTTDDIIIIITDEEEYFRKKFVIEKLATDEWKCTICAKTTKDKPYPHPALRVSICFDCLNSYENAIFLTNKDGTDKNCRWCTKQAKKYNCSSCTVVFCKDCIERNIDSDFVRNRVVNFSDWNCFICDPKPLWRLRVTCMQAIENKTCCSMEEIETIEIMSQEDRLPASQEALPNSETHAAEFSSDLISPKKVPKPIVESDDDNDSIFKTPLTNNNNNEEINIEQQISADEKKSLSVVLQESEKDFLNFVAVFSKRIDQFSEKFKCRNINSCEQAEKLVNKVSLFCDKAIENFQSFQHDAQTRFEIWRNSVNSAKTQNAIIKEETKQSVVCDNITPPRSKSPAKPKPRNNKSVKKEPKVKIEVPNKPSTKNKNTPKRKFSLSLKTPSPPKEPEFYTSPNEEEDTLDFIERMKHKLPDDNVSPKKNQIFLLSQTDKIPVVQSSPINQTTKKKSPDKNEESVVPKVSKHTIASQNSTPTPESQTSKEKSTEDYLTPIKRKYLKDKKSSNTASATSPENNFTNCSQISSVPSLDIKSEPESDTRSEISNETIIRAEASIPPEQFLIKEEQSPEEDVDPFDKRTMDGNEELLARIRTDFEEDPPANDITVSIENYLCEKSGEFCQSYITGVDSIEDEEDANSKDEKNFGFSDDDEDTDKTEDYDWTADFENSIKDKDDDKQSAQDSSFIVEQNGDKSKTMNEELSEEITAENKPEAPVNKDLSKSSEDEVENICYSDAETIMSDTEYDREAAFRALKSDLSDFGLSCESETESIDTDTDCEQQSPERKVTYETGYVRQLDIAAEIAKLRENNREIVNDDEEQESSDTEHSDIESIPDRKLQMKAVVKLDRREIEEYVQKNKISLRSRLNNDDDEVNRLIDLTSLKKRNIISSDSDSDISEPRKKRKKKKLKRSSKESEASSTDTDSNESFKSIKSEHGSDDFIFDLTQNNTDYVPNIYDDLLNDAVSTDAMSEDDDVIFQSQDKKKEKNTAEILITDDDEPEKTIKEDNPKSNWRKDKLLTDALVLSNSDTDITNDSTANEILEKQEERYLKNVDKEKPKRKLSVISSSDTENDPIVLSGDDSNSNDSDIQFVDLKRKRETEEDESQGLNKKGRRNIREVLKDTELREETKKADKLEAQRKERLTQKQKTLDTILSESQLSQEEVGFVLDVDEEKKEPLVTVHHTLVPRLKEHQKKGIKFMWDGCFESVAELKRSKGTGCILAHCMGLGKTMQVVVLSHTLLTHEETNVKHVLIICPLSTVFNWRNEFEQTLKVCPKRIRIFDIRPDRQKNFNDKMFEVKRWRSEGGVLILGYESFQSLVNEDKLNKIEESYKKVMLESLVDPGANLVVCDEGHMLKNGKTLRFTSLSKIATNRRIILTGTPLQNNLIEYYYMVNFVKPHLLGTLDEYKNRFVNPILNGQYEDSNREDISLMKKRSHILHKKLETTVQRYEETELAPYLPDKIDYVLSTQLTPLQIKLYEHYLQLLDLNTKKLFKNYHALQNIWTHPALLKIKFDKRKEPKKKQKRYDEDFVVPALDPDSEDIAGLETEWFKDLLPDDILTNISYGVKMEILFSVIKECGAVNDKLLVFSSSIDELDLIEIFLKQIEGETWIKGIDYYRMDGTVVPEKRMKYCNEFNNKANKRARVFLVSHKVGGLGLNLTAANRVVLMDVSWNPAYDIQSVFRVYRFGQTKTCFIYRFVSMGTMEEVVYSRAVTKLAISCRVVDEHQIKRHFNSDDLQRMYRLIKDFGEPPTLAVPSDRLLAKLWETHKPLLYKFCDHQSLLENLAHEELNAEEMKLAWDEFRHEVDREKEAREMANNRYANYIAQQSIPLNIPSSYSITLPNNPIVKPQDFQRLGYQHGDNFRYKRANKLPTPQEVMKRVHYFNNTIGLAPHSFQNQVTPSTSAIASNANSTPSTSGYIPLVSNSIWKSFPAVSTSVNPNFTASSTSNNNGTRYWHTSQTGHVSNVQTNKNFSKVRNPVTIQVPNSQIYPGIVGSNGVTTIRNNGNKTYGNQISNSNVPTGIVSTKFKPSEQKENIQVQNVEKGTIENLNRNGVSLHSKNDTSSSNKINEQQNLTALLENYLIN